MPSQPTLWPVEFKRCSQCERELPVAAFSKNRYSADGLHTICRECVSQYRRTYKKSTPLEKRCSECKEVRPASLFYKNCCSPDGLQNVCNGCKKSRNKIQWQKTKADPVARQAQYAYTQGVAHRRRLKRHGVDPETYAKLAAQGCAICGGLPMGRSKERLSFDHDHQTGKFRGLLCSKCNAGLGCLCDNAELLRKAAQYLEEHQE